MTHVLYVLKRYPRLSETFVVREICQLEAAGATVSIDALLPAESGLQHPEVASVRAVVRYIARHPRLRSASVAHVHLRVGVRRPSAWIGCALRARRDGTWRRFVQAGFVADRVRREGITHVHAHFATAACEVAQAAAALAGVPFTVTAHAKDIFHTDNIPHLARRVAGAASVVTVSEFNVAHLRQTVPNTPVRFIANGMAAASMHGPARLGPVLCVARLVAKKGVDTLLEAVALAAPDFPMMRVEIIGDGELSEPLQTLAHKLGIAERVRFLGPQSSDAVMDAYRRCSVLALPCRVTTDGDRDGMPTVILEALARGIPVVSTDVCGINEVVHHGQTGLLVEPDDPHALAAAIGKLWSDSDLAGQLGRAGRDLVLRRHNPAQSAQQMLALFQEVAR
jgi:colanic acid/amylovoran biosynthesis glycosyltransferase